MSYCRRTIPKNGGIREERMQELDRIASSNPRGEYYQGILGQYASGDVPQESHPVLTTLGVSPSGDKSA